MRSGAETEQPDQLVGSMLAIVGLVVVLLGILIFVVLDDDDGEPTSP